MQPARSVGLFMSAALSLLLGASSPTVNEAELSGTHRGHRLKLEAFAATPGRPVGLLVKARINGGPIVSLLLDSGSQYVALNRKAAVRAGCAGGADLDLVGVDASSPALVKTLSAGTIEIGDLTVRGVPMLMNSRDLGEGLDGVLPLSLFAGFVVRLDIPAKTLDLVPYPPRQEFTPGSVSAVSSNGLLFLGCVFNGTHEGNFLIDTGAAYNAISRKVAGQLNGSATLASSVRVQGIVARDVPLLPDWVRLRLGSRELAAEPVVVIDLSTASRYHNLEVTGLIGYPALRESILTVNYRDRLVRIDPR